MNFSRNIVRSQFVERSSRCRLRSRHGVAHTLALILAVAATGAAMAAPHPPSKTHKMLTIEEVPSSAGKGPKETVFKIVQSTSQLGKMTVYAGQTGFKITGVAGNGEFVCRAPDWKVVAFHKTDKLIFECSYKEFLHQGLPGLIATSDYFDGKKLSPQQVSYFGLPALMVTAPTTQGTVGMAMPTYSGIGRTTAKSLRVSVFASKKADIPAKVLLLMQTVYKLPKFGGFPLGTSYRYDDNTTGLTLRTESIQKLQLSADKTFVYPPKGYKLVKTAEAALLSGMLESTFAETP